MAREMAKEIIQPVPMAFLICNQIITEVGTNKKSLIGIFDEISLSKFPSTYGPLALYARLYDGEGTYAFRIDYVATKDQFEQAKMIEGEFSVKERYRPIELAISVGAIPIPEPSQYEFRLWIENRYTQKAKFTVVRRESR